MRLWKLRVGAEGLARDYFTFMSWLYAGPFICDFRNAALAREEHVLDLPFRKDSFPGLLATLLKGRE